MTWNNLTPFAVGQVLTSTVMNYMRDNANIGHPVCTSSTRPASPDTGTMIYQTDTNETYVWTGESWTLDTKFRTSNSAVVNNYRVPPMCLLRRTSNSANLTQSTTHTIDFATANAVQVVNTDGMHSLASNSTRITPTTAGVYLFVATVQLTGSPSFHDIRLTKNGGTQIAIARVGNVAGGTVTAMQSMNGTTDYMEVVLNVGTGTFQIATSNSETTFQATWQGQVS